jgi:hypothetical protein
METKWVRPVPIGVRTEGKGNKQLDVIETEVGHLRVDFYLDRKTRLPIRLVTDEYNGIIQMTEQLGMVIKLEDYVAIDGILMPQRVTRVPKVIRSTVGEVSRQDTESARYKFDVEFDPTIFDHPVSRKVKPDDWKPQSPISASSAQATRVNSATDIPALIKKLKDDKDEVALQTAEELGKLGQPVVLPLQEFLKKERGCRPRVLAAQLLTGLAPDSEVIVSSMLDVVKNPCYWSPQRDLIVRRNAAFVLANTVAGVRTLTEMLKSKKTFERRSAVFAFDELTEKIEGVRPDSISATPAIISATKAAIPSLIQALNDKDEIVYCVAYESLEQLQRSKHDDLRDEANRLMKGVNVRCSR